MSIDFITRGPLTALTPASPTRADLVARALALRPILEKNAGRTEDERRVAEENIQAIEAAESLYFGTY